MFKYPDALVVNPFKIILHLVYGVYKIVRHRYKHQSIYYGFIVHYPHEDNIYNALFLASTWQIL